MQHVGDLQPFERPFTKSDRAPVGRYSAKRSRWRLAIGTLEIGFDRASEKIHAETGRDRPGWVQRALILFGMFCVSMLVIALVGWMWSARGPVLGGDTVSAAIVDRDAQSGSTAMSSALFGSPDAEKPVPATATRPAFIQAVIEKRAPAPAVAPARKATVEIAQGLAFAPRAAETSNIAVPTPDDAIVESGNFLLIPPVDRAVGIAMRDGEAQNWTAGDYHGVVVVGDAEPKDGKSCRRGTILLRDGSTKGRTQSFERCI
jgi:hypothetical protein